MQKSLGIYVENKLIKYAKVSKEKNELKVESFGVTFFENLGQEIEKIIEETFSFNTPISINLANEKYLYFDVFALLSKKDIAKTVETEFETYCEEKQFNKNAFENRFALIPNLDENEKIKALDIYVNKIDLDKQLEPFSKNKVTRVTPTSIAIASIVNSTPKENQIVINMEENTTITAIVDRQIYDIKTIEKGSEKILQEINKVENSYSKAYEICKNTTIYTADAESVENTEEEQPYLQYIVPQLYKIVQEVKKYVDKKSTKFQTMYLTGTLACINNIDLYFQEFFPNLECKILKPKFLEKKSTKINIKDYIEVNTAIALATNNLGEGIQGLNFKKNNVKDNLSNILTMDVGGKGKKAPSSKKLNLNWDFRDKLTISETWMLRTITTIALLLIIFIVFSKLLSNQMLDKEQEIVGKISQQNSQISAVDADVESLDSKTTKYRALISQLEELSDRISETASRKNSIPNLLNQIMHIIPEKVQITSIKNTTDRHIVIVAQSEEYDQLGYFIAKLKTQEILTDVVSSSGVKSDGVVNVTIEGELP